MHTEKGSEIFLKSSVPYLLGEHDPHLVDFTGGLVKCTDNQ